MGFGIPDFSEIEKLGKNLVQFMDDVKTLLNDIQNKQQETTEKLNSIITTLKEKP